MFAKCKDKCRSAPCAAKLFGTIFIVVAVLGFIPNPIVSANGIFMVNLAHNVLHALVGVLLIVAARMGYAKQSLLVFGIVYVLLAILGYMMPMDAAPIPNAPPILPDDIVGAASNAPANNMLFGLVMVNRADHYLHPVLGLVLIAAGVYVKPQKA